MVLTLSALHIVFVDESYVGIGHLACIMGWCYCRCWIQSFPMYVRNHRITGSVLAYGGI